MVRFPVGGLLGAAVLVVVCGARAQGFPDEPAILEYEKRPGAEECPGEEYFRDLVELQRRTRDKEFLRPDPYDDASVVVRVTLERADGKFRGTITHLPPAGAEAEEPKVYVNSECVDLLRDLAFPASFFLPFVPFPPPPASGPAAPQLPPVRCPACPPPAPPPRACDPQRKGDPDNDRACLALLATLGSIYGPRMDPSFWLGGGPLMTLLFTSDPGPGFFLTGILQGRHWSVGVEAQVTLPAPIRVDTPGGGADFDRSSFVGLLVPCGRVGEQVRFVGCAVLGAGAVISYDSQAPTLKTGVSEAFRLGPRAGVEVLLGDPKRPRVSLFAMGDLGFAPITADIAYNGVPVYKQNVASLFLSVGASFRLTD